MKHGWPCPTWCVETQSFAEHEAWAKALGLCSRPGAGCKGYYYGGKDLAPPAGRVNEDIPVYATKTGPVQIKDEGRVGYGLHIRQTTGPGELTIYAHLSRTLVQQGDLIVKGKQIGWMGSTGNSTGKHIHWEIRVNGIPVDPMLMIGDGVEDPPEPPAEFKLPTIPVLPKAVVSDFVTIFLRIRATPKNGLTVGKLLAGEKVSVTGVLQDGSDVWFSVLTDGQIAGWCAAYFNGETWLIVGD